MSDWRPKKCRDCGAPASEAVAISKRGLCPACGIARVQASLHAMTTMDGPQADKWRRNLAAAAGVAPPGGVGGSAVAKRAPRRTRSAT